MRVSRRAMSGYNSRYNPIFQSTVHIAHKRNADLLHDPVYNKGTGFCDEERKRLGLHGLLPPRTKSLEQQMRRCLVRYYNGPKVPTEAEGVSTEQVRKWRYLTRLKDRNEALYYKLLVENFAEMAPIVYTPTVGWACANYSDIFDRPRGMYFSAEDVGHMDHMVYNWSSNEVDAIVVTDGSRILGLGDLGVGGMGISIGKLDLYVGAAGFHPGRVLPCVIDVGTDNERLLNDPDYLGLRQTRLRGDEYVKIVDEFVQAVTQRWPRAVLQFEDFSTENANNLLMRYREHHNCFNDDIQGTAATALAGIYGALRVQSKPVSAIKDMKFVVCGAGSAGMGVTDFLKIAMVQHGLSEEEARSRFYVIDDKGLVTTARSGLPAHVETFAQTSTELEGKNILETLKLVKPQVLMGLTGVGGLFTQEILKEFGSHHERPILFPMSNPTHKMECTAEEAQAACDGRAIFASGSPQPDVITKDGTTIASSQSNNMYIFPGLALGAKLLDTSMVSDGMLMAGAEAVPEMLTAADLRQGRVYPNLNNIRSISTQVASRVMTVALQEDLTSISPRAQSSRVWGLKNLIKRGDEERLKQYITMRMYRPEYEVRTALGSIVASSLTFRAVCVAFARISVVVCVWGHA